MRALTACEGSEPESVSFFFFNDTATTEIYTLSLHDALPILSDASAATTSSSLSSGSIRRCARCTSDWPAQDRKSTRLNSSHGYISYAVFCLKKKKPTKSTAYRRAIGDAEDHNVRGQRPRRDT